MYTYQNTGTCSKSISFELEDGRIHSISFEDGCNGNLKALSILAEGMKAQELIGKLKGLQCGSRGTSCGDQLSRALEKAMAEKAAS